jgi:plastocyanin
MIFCGMVLYYVQGHCHRHTDKVDDPMQRSLLLLILFATALLIPRGVDAKPAKPKDVEISIKGMKFGPDTVTIKPGQTVTWTNNDQRDHTVAAADGSFNSGNLGPGATYSFKFTKPGTYHYACTLHPRMKAEIVVK